MSCSYENSVVFSEKLIEELNEMISDKIDPRLFFAAYYSPKRYCFDSAQYSFWCAVTNAYGLVRDCGKFIDSGQINCLDILYRHNLISSQDRRKIKNHICLICNLRSLFCHNSSGASTQSSRQFSNLVNFLDRDLGIYITTRYLPYNIQFRDNEWELALKYICCETDSCIKVLSQGIEQIPNHPKHSEIAFSWLQGIIDWYERHENLIYPVAADFYDLLLSQARGRVQRNNKPTIVKAWIKANGAAWKQQYRHVVLAMSYPALPFETTMQIIKATNPQIF